MRGRIIVAVVLLAVAWLLPHVRHRLINDVTTWDAPPAEPALLPSGIGPGLAPAPRVRVVLVDGLAADTARALPTWSATCARGVSVTVDVGFPTVSLPVEVALWSGLTQQQTGIVFRSDRPLEPPLDVRGIPAQVADSRAIAQDHGYIVRSLGFAHAEPAADPTDPARDAEPTAWASLWLAHAHAAVSSQARLVFVHVLEVDTAGHAHGHDSDQYRAVAADADRIVAQLVADAPDARWFLVSDHGHLDGAHGGHGGEEREVRQVSGCIAGPGVAPASGSLVHVVDIARAIADSTGAKLDAASRGRPLSVALAAPLAPDQAVPTVPGGRAAIAIVLLVVGALFASYGVRRWWLAPWWFAIAGASLVALRGEPTLSTPMTYAPNGLDMTLAWLPALAVCAVTTWHGLRVARLRAVVASQLGLPAAAIAAAVTACGAWPALFGAEVAPVAPHVTAWTSAVLLVTAHGAAAVALAVLGKSARSAFGRRARPETPRSAP
ncbi:MAG TPA: alkaline phosphatase family protein [Kofleriaceae bacterium]|nr:alkaline phosphatase family protein [Kofleriaceae bacterium]